MPTGDDPLLSGSVGLPNLKINPVELEGGTFNHTFQNERPQGLNKRVITSIQLKPGRRRIISTSSRVGLSQIWLYIGFLLLCWIDPVEANRLENHEPRNNHTLAARGWETSTVAFWIILLGIAVVTLMVAAWLRYRHHASRISSPSTSTSTTSSDVENQPRAPYEQRESSLAPSQDSITPQSITIPLPSSHLDRCPSSTPSSMEVIRPQSTYHGHGGRKRLTSRYNSLQIEAKSSTGDSMIILPDGVTQAQVQETSLPSIVLPPTSHTITQTALNQALGSSPPSPFLLSPSVSFNFGHRSNNDEPNTNAAGNSQEMSTPPLHSAVVEGALLGTSTGGDEADVDVSVDRQPQTSTPSETPTRDYQECNIIEVAADWDLNTPSSMSSIRNAPPPSYLYNQSPRGWNRTRSLATLHTESSISTLPPYPGSEQDYESDNTPLSRAPTYTSTISSLTTVEQRNSRRSPRDSRAWPTRNLPPLPFPPLSGFNFGGQTRIESDQENLPKAKSESQDKKLE